MSSKRPGGLEALFPVASAFLEIAVRKKLKAFKLRIPGMNIFFLTAAGFILIITTAKDKKLLIY